MRYYLRNTQFVETMELNLRGQSYFVVISAIYYNKPWAIYQQVKGLIIFEKREAQFITLELCFEKLTFFLGNIKKWILTKPGGNFQKYLFDMGMIILKKQF